jgi:hypothetical protein
MSDNLPVGNPQTTTELDGVPSSPGWEHCTREQLIALLQTVVLSDRQNRQKSDWNEMWLILATRESFLAARRLGILPATFPIPGDGPCEFDPIGCLDLLIDLYRRTMDAAIPPSKAGESRALPEPSLPDVPTPDFCLLPGYRVRWEDTTDLPPRLWQLFEYLLRAGKNLQVDDVIEAVWQGKLIDEKTLRNRVYDLDNRLVEIGFPHLWRVKGGQVIREG